MVIKALVFAGERRGQVEAEAVDVHFLDPVAERVHHELQYPWVAQVEGIAAAGEVHVVALVTGREVVIRSIVDPAKRQCRAELAAFRRMIVDYIQDHLDAGGVQYLNQRLEFAEVAGAKIGRMRGEEGERVVAPVVAEAAFG